jgi:uncharacterized protein (UPF0335 family)
MSTENVAADELRQYIERIECLEEEMDSLKSDRKDVYAEARAVGFDTKTLRQIIRLRKKDKDTRDHEDALLETYRDALGV